MKNKKIFILLMFVLILILIALYFIIQNFNTTSNNDENSFLEYTPEEEISSKQLRETIVTLYFVDSENNIKSEGKLIDSATLLNNPYKELINLLLLGPDQEQLNNVFPNNTNLLDATLENNCVTLNFSNELLNYADENQKNNIINCVLNTLTELNEVNSVKILIDNTLSNEFAEEYKIVL